MKSRIPKQFAGGGQDMNAMIHQARKMQDQITALQEDIEQRSFTGTAGGGAVTTVVKGNKTIESITLKPEVVDPEDIEMLEDLIVAAANEAIRKVDEETGAAMSKLTGGLGGGMPGIF